MSISTQSFSLNNNQIQYIESQCGDWLTFHAIAVAKLWICSRIKLTEKWQYTGLGGGLALVQDKKLPKNPFCFILFDLNSSELLFKLELYEDIHKYYQDLSKSFYRVRLPLCQSYIGFSFAHEQDAEQFKKLVFKNCKKSDIGVPGQIDQPFDQDDAQLEQEELDRINCGELTLQERQIIKHAGIRKKEFFDERSDLKSFICQAFLECRKSSRQSYSAFQKGVAKFRKNRQTMLNQQKLYESQQKQSQLINKSQQRLSRLTQSQYQPLNKVPDLQLQPQIQQQNPLQQGNLNQEDPSTNNPNTINSPQDININPFQQDLGQDQGQGQGQVQLQNNIGKGQQQPNQGQQLLPPPNIQGTNPLQTYQRFLEQQEQLQKENQDVEETQEDLNVKSKLVSINCSQNLNDLQKARKTIQMYKQQIKLIPDDGFQSIVKDSNGQEQCTLQPPPYVQIFQEANQQDNPVSSIFKEQKTIQETSQSNLKNSTKNPQALRNSKIGSGNSQRNQLLDQIREGNFKLNHIIVNSIKEKEQEQKSMDFSKDQAVELTAQLALEILKRRKQLQKAELDDSMEESPWDTDSDQDERNEDEDDD